MAMENENLKIETLNKQIKRARIQEKYELAIELIEEYLTINPNDEEMLKLKGNYEKKLGIGKYAGIKTFKIINKDTGKLDKENLVYESPEQREKLLDLVKDIGPEDLEDMNNHIKELKKEAYKRREIELKLIDEELKEDPENLELLENKLTIYETIDRDKEDILEVLDEILKIDPEYYEMFEEKSRIYMDSGRGEEVLNMIHDRLKKDSDNIKLRLMEIEALHRLGKIKKSLELMNQFMLDYDEEEYYPFLEYYEHILDELESSKSSIELLERLLEINPNNHNARLKLTKLYNKENNYEKSFENYDYLINKSDDEIYKNCGILDKVSLLRKLKRFDEAIDTLEISPDFGNEVLDFIIEESLIYRDMGEYQIALDIINTISFSNINCEKGSIYFYWGKYDEAIECFKEETGPDMGANYWMGLALKEKGDYSKSIEFLNRVEDLGNDITKKYHDDAQKLIAEIKTKI